MNYHNRPLACFYCAECVNITQADGKAVLGLNCIVVLSEWLQAAESGSIQLKGCSYVTRSFYYDTSESKTVIAVAIEDTIVFWSVGNKPHQPTNVCRSCIGSLQ